MTNLLKYLTLILVVAYFSQKSIAKKEDAITGKPNEFIDANGDLVSGPEDAKNSAKEDNLLQILDETKNRSAVNQDIAEVTTAMKKMEQAPLEEAMLKEEETSDIARDAGHPAADDIPPPPAEDEIPPPLAADEIPMPPVEEEMSIPTPPSIPPTADKTPMPSETIPPPVEDEIPLPPAIDEPPLPSPKEENLDIARGTDNPAADDTPTPPAEGGIPSLLAADEIPMPLAVPPVEEEIPSPIPPSMSPPTEDKMLEPPATDETPLPSPPEVIEPTLAAGIPSRTPEVDMGIPTTGTDTQEANTSVSQMTPPVDTSRLPEEQTTHEKTRSQAEKQRNKQAVAQNEFQAKAIQRAQQRQLEQHLAKQEAIELQERQRALQKQIPSQTGSHGSLERLDLEQERIKPQAKKNTGTDEPSKGIAKTRTKANRVQGVGHHNISETKEEPSQSAKFSHSAGNHHNTSAHKEGKQFSTSLTDEHGNLIHQDELNSGGEKEKPISILSKRNAQATISRTLTKPQ